MSKPVVLNTILGLLESEIKDRYPYGVLEQKDRYTPCPEGQKPDKTLAELLAEKEARVQPDIFPHKDSSRGYTTVPALAMPNIGASPSKKELDDYATDNWQRFLAGLESIDSRKPSLYVQRRINKKAA